jgi:hypothetical protein
MSEYAVLGQSRIDGGSEAACHPAFAPSGGRLQWFEKFGGFYG